MRRVRLRFAGGVEVEFADRDRALAQVREVAERGTYPVYVMYGPEGCGKSALFMQARVVLEGYGYNVIHVNPMAGEGLEALAYTPSLRDIVVEALRLFPDTHSRVVDVALSAAGMALRRLRKPRLALLMDDVFQAVGLDRAERLVKTLLNLIEYPPGDYDRIVVLVASSEGVTWRRVGRHRWASIYTMWNMSEEGFRQLYEQVPGGAELGFRDAWRLTGGNPWLLARLYEARWRVEEVVDMVIHAKGLRDFVRRLEKQEKQLLLEAVEDPDVIFEGLGEEATERLESRLIELNLIAIVPDRVEYLWIDTPPPEKDLGLGVGRYYAWQNPLYREAVRKVLQRQ